MKIAFHIILMCVAVISFSNSSQSQSLYSKNGKASFYAKKFDGRKTANGEIFYNKKLTAAHLQLPFGTMVRVTNLKNKKSVIVRINDRGPYVKGRIIDLTNAAADSLDFIHSGWAEVLVEELPRQIENLVVVDENKIMNDTSVFNFPSDWVGKWKGDLKIYSTDGLKQIIPMQLNILPTILANRFTWMIFYNNEPRIYELVIRDSVKRVYSIDEKNGIEIMSYLLGNHFISRFEIEGQLLESEYTLQNKNELTFEIRSGNEERIFSTGNVVLQNDSVPKVDVFEIYILQIAELKKVNE